MSEKSQKKQLSAQLRTEDFGSAGSRRVIRSGRIPAVIYGKSAPVHITLDAKEFGNKVRHFSETTLLTITAGKKEFDCLMKDIRRICSRVSSVMSIFSSHPWTDVAHTRGYRFGRHSSGSP
jgi:ribosomal protein L25 (general stress protein Ctc)